MANQYDAIRAAVDASGEDERVEVNQRALIDKILARYASAGAVYRELLQNSNDAEAKRAEIRFTTGKDNAIAGGNEASSTAVNSSTSSTAVVPSTSNNNKSHSVTQVVYRNDGLPFRPQDWSRLRKIAEGNPNPQKVGAFGVGAYTMFSIAEEPMVISGSSALKFLWKGDALWTKTMNVPIAEQEKTYPQQVNPWTTFVLPSRDPYPLPDWVTFGQFLAASLTFTKSLDTVSVYVNDLPILQIKKDMIQAPQLIIADAPSSSDNKGSSTLNKITSWFGSSTSAVQTPRGLFQLDKADSSNPQQNAIYESIYQITVTLKEQNDPKSTKKVAPTDKEVATIRARHITATAVVKLPKDMIKRMHRVTKKDPPQKLPLEIYLDSTTDDQDEGAVSSKQNGLFGRSSRKKVTKAQQIANSFRPTTSSGRIFIGFKTSQTTGVAAHVAAPFLPTVEREAMDLQDATLRVYNMELLHLAGVVLRFTLQHAFARLQTEWRQNTAVRKALLLEQQQKDIVEETEQATEAPEQEEETEEVEDDDEGSSTNGNSGGFMMGFARFMARGVQKKIKSVVTTVVTEVGNTIKDSTKKGIDYNALVTAAPDPRPLCREEYAAILLMQSFCPSPSTPDPIVGTCLAQGFGECMPNTPPPVLTAKGVVPASEARLPSHGMEAFCHITEIDDDEEGETKANVNETVVTKSQPLARPAVVRNVILEQTQEYHSVIAAECRPLDLERDLLPYLQEKVLDQDVALRLVQWWKPYSRILAGQYSSRHHLNPYDYSYNTSSGSNVTMRVQSTGLALKEAICFHFDSTGEEEKQPDDQSSIVALRDYLFYLEKDSPLAQYQNTQMEAMKDGNRGSKPLLLPIPETVLPTEIQELMGETTLNDSSFSNIWFEPLPMDLWADFISNDPIMTDAKEAHVELRLAVLSLLFQEFKRRPSHGYGNRREFGNMCRNLLANRKCIPFDPASENEKTKESDVGDVLVDFPSVLYLYSAELKAFEGVSGSFHKVSKSVQDAGVTEDFLLALGVRKSVSIDFLFENLDSLQWSSDPRPLVEYLKSATLTQEDMTKLSRTRYLPAAENSGNNTKQQNYAPSELYLPSVELRILPFVKMMNWPSEDELSERSSSGRFLVSLGMKVMPPLTQVLQYLSQSQLSEKERSAALDFVSNHLSPSAAYHAEYNRMAFAVRKRYQFLPCTSLKPLATETQTVSSKGPMLMSPPTCFSDAKCAVMGFPVLSDDNKVLGKRRDYYANVFQCPQEPEATALIHQLLTLVGDAKKKQKGIRISKEEGAAESMDMSVLSVFAATFNYLSHRSSDFSSTLLASLRHEDFIPCIVKESGRLEWFRVDQVFFSKDDTDENSSSTPDSLTKELFQVVEFSPFLAAVGVKQDATTKELFKTLLDDPKSVMNSLGNDEKKYRALLRRIAADPPFSRVSQKIRQTPFLLAYTLHYSDEEEKKNAVDSATFDLKAASDIYIIDNSFFGRMFKVDRAPHETDLEDFYSMIGCKYISKSVDKRFEVVGKPLQSTPLTKALQERVTERAPLLVSPHVTTRPLVENAAAILDSSRLEFFQASNLLAVYSLRGTTRRSQTTCFSRQTSSNPVSINPLGKGSRNSIYVVENFDWFDVGYAIGDLILKRCQLEDAFFISSLLDAPLEQLRARGFPVDRILQPAIAPEPVVQNPSPAPESAKKVAKPVATAAAQADGTPLIWNPDGTIAKDIPPREKPQNPKANNTKKATNGKGTDNKSAQQDGAFEDILSQMFPDVDPEFVKSSLGKNPKLEDVRQLAEVMASGNYPKKQDVTNVAPSESYDDDATIQSEFTSATEESSTTGKKKGKKSLRKKLGRALGFGGSKQPSEADKKPSAAPIPPIPTPGPTSPTPPPGALSPSESSTREPATPDSSDAGIAGAMGNAISQGLGGMVGGGAGGVSAPSGTQTRHETQGPVAPAEDIHSHQNLERLLEQSVGSSTSVNRHGVESPDTNLTTSIPEELDHSCEVIDGQSLKPFAGPQGTYKTRNGIRTFSSRREEYSELLLQNTEAVESFAFVLENLAKVFGIKIDSIAIFCEPGGKSIAFNLNRALHFNLRFFYALHFMTGKSFSRECYSYWYITMAHELSHNLVSGHTKEHGFYTESFATKYLPKLVDLLASLN